MRVVVVGGTGHVGTYLVPRLGYEPRYSSLQAVQESVAWLIAHGQVPGMEGKP